MSVMATGAIGHRRDDAFETTTWLCSEPCFGTARNTPRIRERIYKQQDDKRDEYKANLHDALIHEIATRPDPAYLPDGLRVTEDDIARLVKCEGDYCSDTKPDEAVISAAFKLLRNHKRLPYYHCKDGVGEIWDYDELKARLDNLARGNK